MPEFIFTMQEVTRVHPPDKKVLENITLAFYPGAKIGVIGNNGSGKSSLLRIMAGVDKDFMGEAKPHPGTKVGYFAQEPDLGSAKTVIDAVNEGVADIRLESRPALADGDGRPAPTRFGCGDRQAVRR